MKIFPSPAFPLFVFLGSAGLAFAQKPPEKPTTPAAPPAPTPAAPAPGELPDSILVKPRASIPDVNADALKPKIEEAPEAPVEQSMLPLLEVPISEAAYTSRNFVGLGLSYSNTGVTRGFFKITEDKVLQGKVSEKSWGMGLIMDLGWSEETASSFRIKWGLSRVRVGLTDALRAANGPDTLEESLNIFSSDFLLRDVLPADEPGLWWGGGFSIHYAWSSSTGGAGGNRSSKLRYSTALSPMLSIGSDVRLDHGQQLIVQGDWLLVKAFQLTVGLRTQL
ncbi:MAG: hypothetical protein ABIR96_01870 [Bdellovibrionota bacterium]